MQTYGKCSSMTVMRGLEKMTMGGEKKTMSSYRVNETKRNSTNDVKTDHDEMRSR